MLASFDALVVAYLDCVDWEPRPALQARAASLSPALLLARVDGKSPVEYLTGDDQKALVRGVAEPLLRRPPATLKEVRDAWRAALEGNPPPGT